MCGVDVRVLFPRVEDHWQGVSVGQTSLAQHRKRSAFLGAQQLADGSTSGPCMATMVQASVQHSCGPLSQFRVLVCIIGSGSGSG